MGESRGHWGCAAGAAIMIAFMWMFIALAQEFMQPRASLVDLDDNAAGNITQRVEAEEQTERTRIANEAETERQRIEGRNAGTRGFFILLGVLGAVGLAGFAIFTWGRVEEVRATAQPTIPPHLLAEAAALLAAKPGRRVDEVDGDWYVVDDRERTLYPLLPGAVSHWTEEES